ncbi:MAG TPA: fimbria/pilus outer membrane usher protein [Casimicrobiaceae bacterium]
MLAVAGPASAQPSSTERVPPGAAPPAVLPTAPVAGEEELLLQVDVNAQGLEDTVLALRASDGKIAVPVDSLDRWRLRRPDAPPRFHAGMPYYALDAIPGVTYAYDAARQKLAITAPARAFTATQFVNAQAGYPSPTVSQLGAFLNYNLFASRASGESQYAGQFETGVFSAYGVLIAGLLAQDNADTKNAVRLDTTWTTDFPERLSTLRVGDAINVPGAWGRAVRFGGVQYSTNFATQPGYVTFPAVATGGQAALPSTVDVFVNNALVAQKTVPPGPFSITNIPTVNGSGNVQLVVRDLFGREQIISQPFYASVNLLKPGLEDFSYEAGFERNNFGSESNDYGHAVASATYRRGLTDQLTGEIRGEAARNLGVAGVSASYLITGIGVASATAAASGGSAGSGALGGAGFQRQTGQLSIFAQWLGSSASFRQNGATADSPVPLRQWSASVGYQLDRYGSANVTYVAQDFRTKDSVHILSTGYSVGLGSWAFLGLTAVKTFGAHGSVALGATLTVPLGDRALAAVSYNGVRKSSQGASDDTSFTLQRSLPAGEGYGYRVVAHTQREDVQASGLWQNNVGTYELDLSRFEGSTAGRASAAGGVGYVGGHAFASRQITDSFGVVRVADYPSVGVLQDNQLVGRTDAGGYAVLPQLRAYDINRVSIEERDLPLDAQVDKLKMEAVPFFRSGLLLDFPVRRSHGATLSIRLDDGAPMPSGALVRIVGRDEDFPVGLEGEAYLTGLEERNRLRATWKGRSCEFDVEFSRTADPLPSLGTFVCRGVTR